MQSTSGGQGDKLLIGLFTPALGVTNGPTEADGGEKGEKGGCASFFDLENVRSAFRTLLKKRTGNNRMFLMMLSKIGDWL